MVRFGGRVLVDAASGKTAGLASVSHVLPGTLTPPPVGRETRDGLTYLSFRVTPTWTKVPARILSGPARLLVLVDTSRSALESRPVVLASLHALLTGLPSDASFALVASDITCRDYSSDFVPATPGAADAAVRFLRGIEADGATDLGALIRHAGTLVGRLSKTEREKVRIVYFGDGVATWGVTDPKDLTALAAQHLGGLPFHALAFGKSPDRLLRELSAPSGGSLTAPRTLSDVTRFGTLVTAPRLRFLRGVSLKTPTGTEARLRATDAIVEGEPVEAVVALARDEPLPASVVVSAESQAGPYSETLALLAPVDVPHVAKRWAALEIARLEERGATAKDEIVELSTSFGVLSRYTAFLVLENERMYREFGLKRRRPADATGADADAAGATPRVTGKDLESAGGDEPTLSPDRVQPGDPEIRIPAPADARAVTVVFPFGETKSATYDEALSAWTVRFLIPPGTPDGRHEVAIRITHRDDLVEVLRLSYVVDTLAPSVDVTLRPSATAPGAYELQATQVITEAELSAAGEPTGVDATIVSDMRRVEVTLPGGRVVTLAPVGDGAFRAVFTPVKALASPLKVTVTAFDRAQNVSRFDVLLSPSTALTPVGRP